MATVIGSVNEFDEKQKTCGDHRIPCSFLSSGSGEDCPDEIPEEQTNNNECKASPRVLEKLTKFSEAFIKQGIESGALHSRGAKRCDVLFVELVEQPEGNDDPGKVGGDRVGIRENDEKIFGLNELGCVGKNGSLGNC